VRHRRSIRGIGRSRHAGVALICVLALLCLGGKVRAESGYPAKIITLIVPFAAGGPTDVVARIVAESMSTTLGQPIIIENVVGSGGTTAVIRAKRSSADGYTIVMGHMGTHGAAVALYPHLAYDPIHDFVPVGMVAGMPVLILARRDLRAVTLQDFVQLARTDGCSLTMAHAGVGSVSHATCLMLNAIAGSHPRMKAFQGTGPAMNALVDGRVDYMCDQVVSAVPQLAAGAIKAYAVGTESRSAVLPDIPTSSEAGVPTFRASAWNALFAPKGTPKSIVERLNAALGKALDDETVRRRLQQLGGEIPDANARTPAALERLVETEVAKWTAAVGPSDPDH
jgi:tripartite-type tricarboxylate transporter receptor subunit TctC